MIPIPVSSSPGVRPQEGAGRLINVFAEKTEPGARAPVLWKRTAGLRQVLEIASHIHLRGAILVGSTLIAVFDERAYTVTESGGTFSSTNQGALAGDEPITVAKNNAGTPNIVAVTENGAFNLFTSGAPTNFADADLPQPNSVAEINGYLVFTIGDGRIFATGVNNVSVATNSFTTEQSFGGLLRGVTFKGEFYAFGRTGIGVYKDIGASPFPLQRQFAIEKGIVGTHAVAGWEDNWIGELIWVADDNNPTRLNGYTPEPIGNDDVVRDIAAAVLAGDGALLEAFVHMEGRHAMWSLTYPGNWTWTYNATTKNWHERKSYNRNDCRASSSVHAFNRWLTGDRESGVIFSVDPSFPAEGDDPLVEDIYTGNAANFPARIGIPRADFDFTAAVGVASGLDPIETDPSVLIRWSFDGGYTYGNFVTRKLGKQGQGNKQVTVQRIGLTSGKGVRFHLRVSDRVHVGFMGGEIPAEVRSAA